MPLVSVIISTYNQPKWLEKVLWGYEQQTQKDFEIIIADDGSTLQTKDVIECFQKKSFLSIYHVWQEDQGFQKTKILNKAIVASTSEYLIITDGDCIPRKDLVAQHLKYRKKGCFLSAGYFKLPMNISKLITKEDIQNQRCFDVQWLMDRGLKKTFKNNKLSSRGIKEKLLNRFTPTKATWDGNNASGWKNDILAVNGFNECMQYGGEDRELGERLVNYGIKPLQIRYSAITVHLDHARGYVTEEMIAKNKEIRKNTRKKRLIWTPDGIIKKDAPNRS